MLIQPPPPLLFQLILQPQPQPTSTSVTDLKIFTNPAPQLFSFQKKLGPGVLTAFYVGMIVNSLVFGQLCDTWGRKPIFHLTNITFIVCRYTRITLTHIFTNIFRVISFHITSYYIPFIILTALGTGFFPVGVRAGYDTQI